MNISKSAYGLSFCLFVLTFVGLIIPQTAFCQAEKLGIVSYTPPKGWPKTPKGNIVAFSDVNQTTGAFCIITLYGATPGTGNPNSDFAREWNNLVVKPLKAEAGPKTETEVADGWTVTAGGAAVDFQGGKAVAFLTVISKAGTTVSVLGVFNNEAYLSQLTAFVAGMEMDKGVAATTSAAASTPAGLRYDSYGHLIIPPPTRQLTIADLTGEWGQNDGINTRYVYRDSGTYAGADSLHFTNKMTLTAQGGYYNDFFAIQNGRKIKEDTKGSFSVSGSVLFIKEGNLRKYVIRGWLELPDMTIFVVCGPWYNDDVIPADIFTNPDQGSNLDSKWVRKK
jgi:hypothetical protein